MKRSMIWYVSKDNLDELEKKFVTGAELALLTVWRDKKDWGSIYSHNITAQLTFTSKEPPFWVRFRVKLKRIWTIIKE